MSQSSQLIKLEGVLKMNKYIEVIALMLFLVVCIVAYGLISGYDIILTIKVLIVICCITYLIINRIDISKKYNV